MTAGPSDPGRRAAWRAERAEVARRLHPDLGGDAEDLIEALAEVDSRYAPPPLDSAPGRLNAVRRRVNGGLRRSRRGLRALRSRLPRRVPGSRRYIEL